MVWQQPAGPEQEVGLQIGHMVFNLLQTHHPDPFHSSEFAALHSSLIEQVNLRLFQTTKYLRVKARSISLALNGIR